MSKSINMNLRNHIGTLSLGMLKSEVEDLMHVVEKAATW